VGVPDLDALDKSKCTISGSAIKISTKQGELEKQDGAEGKASHIIPQKSLEEAIAAGALILGFTDPYDPAVAIFLRLDWDYVIDKFFVYIDVSCSIFLVTHFLEDDYHVYYWQGVWDQTRIPAGASDTSKISLESRSVQGFPAPSVFNWHKERAKELRKGGWSKNLPAQ
jgi:hypothetical protein